MSAIWGSSGGDQPAAPRGAPAAPPRAPPRGSPWGVRSSRPLQGASGPRGSGEWESFKGRLDATRTVEWPDGRSTRSPHSTLPLWRGALSRGRLAAASGPPPRASRPLATTVRAATSSAGPSFIRSLKISKLSKCGIFSLSPRKPRAFAAYSPDGWLQGNLHICAGKGTRNETCPKP